MTKIFTSASKIVFLSVAVTACIALFTGHISESNFMLLAGGAFTFYFTNKNETVVRKADPIDPTQLG